MVLDSSRNNSPLSVDLIAELKEKFNAMDNNKDGFVTK
jgi:Ca2+-binding EF-hand superfamily protein